jgi:tripartite-type tricarboxylate transporter receptor subunit TctC
MHKQRGRRSSMRFGHRWSFIFLGLVIIVAGFIRPATADTYPAKPIHLIIPFPPGGYGDTVTRLVGQKLSQAFSQPVIVENRPGAGGNIGSNYVAKAAPDGYTILMGSVANATSVGAYADLPYDLTRDLAPVSLVVVVPYVVVVNSRVASHSLKELIQLAQTKSGGLTYASSGNGSGVHLTSVLFKLRTQTDLVHVPYKGMAPALSDVVAGQVAMMFASIDTALPHIRSGKIRPLAITSAKRSSLLPEVPTVAESGLPGFEAAGWLGIWVPTGTPKDIIARLNSETRTALESADIRERFKDFGAEAAPTTASGFARFIRSEIDKWTPVVKAAGVKME